MNDQSISQPARLALISLQERPDLDTAEAINRGPFSIEQIDVVEIEAGLHELAALSPPRVVRKPGGGWQLASS
jgi:hypothetical protein